MQTVQIVHVSEFSVAEFCDNVTAFVEHSSECSPRDGDPPESLDPDGCVYFHGASWFQTDVEVCDWLAVHLWRQLCGSLRMFCV